MVIVSHTLHTAANIMNIYTARLIGPIVNKNNNCNTLIDEAVMIEDSIA